MSAEPIWTKWYASFWKQAIQAKNALRNFGQTLSEKCIVPSPGSPKNNSFVTMKIRVTEKEKTFIILWARRKTRVTCKSTKADPHTARTQGNFKHPRSDTPSSVTSLTTSSGSCLMGCRVLPNGTSFRIWSRWLWHLFFTSGNNSSSTGKKAWSVETWSAKKSNAFAKQSHSHNTLHLQKSQTRLWSQTEVRRCLFLCHSYWLGGHLTCEGNDVLTCPLAVGWGWRNKSGGVGIGSSGRPHTTGLV